MGTYAFWHKVLKKKSLLTFLFGCVNSIVNFNSYFSIQAASGTILFYEMFHGT